MSLEDVYARLATLEERVVTLEAKVDDKEDAQILLYRDRSTCPIGFKPMENAYGRTIVIGSDLRGTVSAHSIDDTKTISMPCSSMIGVAENGFHKVCNIKSDNSTRLSMEIKELIPHVMLMACAKVEPSRPVVP
jgi:hypothetical protein